MSGLTHPKRGRLIVSLGSGWERFSRPLAHADMLGTVSCGDREGALIRRHVDGVYCLTVRGAMTALPAAKVEAAMRAAGGA